VRQEKADAVLQSQLQEPHEMNESKSESESMVTIMALLPANLPDDRINAIKVLNSQKSPRNQASPRLD